MKRLLKKGRIIDGSGKPSFAGSVLLEEGKIADIITGETDIPFDGQVIDCTGKVIVPGFIDAHSHNDWFAARKDPMPYFLPFLEQGITTQVVGNCGFSPFGYEKNTPYKHLLGSGLFKTGEEYGDYSTFAGWCEAAARTTPVNLIPLQGHGSVRIGLSGYENRPLTGEEMKKRDEKLRESLEQGAFGLSLGLQYEPDRYAPNEELEAAARLVAKYNGVLTVHSRAASSSSTSYQPPVGGEPHNLRALKEMIELAGKTGVRLQYSHLLFVGESTWKTAEAALSLIRGARAGGVDICYDFFSMTFGVSVITVILPNWFLSLSPQMRKKRLNHLRLAFETEITKRALGFSFQDIQVAWAGPGGEAITGKRISEIARQWNMKELDTYLKVVEMSEGKGRVNMYRYYNDEILLKLMQDEHSLFMTDAWIEENGVQNAASYVGFPKFLELARQKKPITLEKAVQKMTGATADRFSVDKRGYLKQGYFADVTVFDPERIQAKGDLPQAPEGIEHVFVNGVHVLVNGRTEAGRIIGCGSVLKK